VIKGVAWVERSSHCQCRENTVLQIVLSFDGGSCVIIYFYTCTFPSFFFFVWVLGVKTRVRR